MSSGGDRIVLTPSNPPETALKAQGAKNVTVIHTFDRTVADTEAFVKPISAPPVSSSKK